MALGPIEVLVVGFPGNHFTGEIIPELERLVENETISIVDGIFVRKDDAGEVEFVEFEELGADDELAKLAGLMNQVESLISDEDVNELVSELEVNSSAAIFVFEHTWSKPLRDKIVASQGVLVSNFRVPGMVVDDLMAELETLPDD